MEGQDEGSCESGHPLGRVLNKSLSEFSFQHGTPYQAGTYGMDVNFTEDYPFKPPVVSHLVIRQTFIL